MKTTRNELALCTLLLLILTAFAIPGCGGGLALLNITQISGPGSLDENQVADYSIVVQNKLEVEYAWAVDPASAGDFTNSTLATVTFHASEVRVNTTVVITVTVTGVKAHPSVLSRDVTVVDTNQAPIAAAHCDKDRIGDGQEIQFSDDSTDPEGDDDIIMWEWDFDYDANEGFDPDSDLREPLHQFDVPGEFQVQLRVTDTSAIADLLDTALEIEVVGNIAPVITQVNHSRTTSEAGNSDEAVGLEVVFEDYTPPGGPHNIIWSCDYGYFDDYTSPTPLWFPAGQVLECDITVRVIDEFGLSDSGSVHQWTTSFPTVDNNSAPGNTIVSEVLDTAFNGMMDPSEYIHPTDTNDGTVVFLTFWSTWCGACLDGIPTLLGIYATFENQSDYLHLMTNVGEGKQMVIDFVNLNLYQGPYWPLDTDSSYFTHTMGWNEGSNDMPLTLVFDRDGRCRWAYEGQVTQTGTIESAINELL